MYTPPHALSQSLIHNRQMEGKNLIRFLFLTFSVALLLFTLLNLPFAPAHSPDLFDCTTYSPWCTSKNRLFSKKTQFLHKPPNPTRRLRLHSSNVAHHPLDPLTLPEINRVKTILSSHAPFKSASSYALHSLVLQEPSKATVLRWRKGEPLPPRQASVIARVSGHSYVLTVDIETGDVTQLDEGPVSGYPPMTMEDMTWAVWAPLSNADFNRTIIARGIDLADLACLPISSGWFGKTDEQRRLIKVQCYSMQGTANFYMRPIEGLTVLLDMDTKEVVAISDKGKNIPLPKAAGTEYRYSEQRIHINQYPLNPISIEQPKGPSFTVEDGHLVKWANWEFHLKPDPRAGVIISRAMFRDPGTGKLRSVMYKGFTSELFVPYMDPTDAWYFKTYMDAGEYGFGHLAMELDPLNDCPRNAYYMDGVFSAADGTPYVRSNMICVFESYAGDIGWRHSECPITGMEVKER